MSVARRVLREKKNQVKVHGIDANDNVKETLKQLRKLEIFRLEGDSLLN